MAAVSGLIHAERRVSDAVFDRLMATEGTIIDRALAGRWRPIRHKFIRIAAFPQTV